MLTRQGLIVVGSLVGLGLIFATQCSSAKAGTFYEGKTLTVVPASAPGGVGDLRVRTVTQYLQKYLPGKPDLVFQYMPGAGGTRAANHMARAAKRDGLTIANIGSSLFANVIFGAPGVRYKLNDFVFFGSAYPGNPNALVIRPKLGLDTVDKLKAYKGLRFAARSVGHSQYILGRIMAFVLDLQDPKWVVGYSSTEVNTAIERGEADARPYGLPSLLRQRPQWLKEGFTIPVVAKNTAGRGAELFPRFPQDRPYLEQYADTKLKRSLLQLYISSRPGSSVFLVPKGVPEATLGILQGAFQKIWNDPQFAIHYKRMTGEPLDPITEEDIQRVLQRMPKDPKVMEVYKQVIGAEPLPRGR